MLRYMEPHTLASHLHLVNVKIYTNSAVLSIGQMEIRSRSLADGPKIVYGIFLNTVIFLEKGSQFFKVNIFYVNIVTL
jgi:hypothetical protein